jgi:hypothetical protein
MTNMQRLVLVLGIVFAVLLGILIATTFLGGGSTGPGATATSSPAASAAPAPSGAAASPGGTSPGGSPSEAPSASAAPSPTPTPVPKATITFLGLKVDAASDTAGRDRIFTWTSGAGAITVQYSSPAATGSAKACLSAAGKLLGCHSGASGKLSAKTTKAKESFTLKVRGVTTATPVIDVTISFVAASPSVKIQNARFDGTGYPDTNGLQVVATPRAAGSYRVQASWGGHPFLYEVDLMEQGGPGTQTLANQGPATLVDQSFPVTPPNPWKIVLQNIEEGFGATSLTATFSWP